MSISTAQPIGRDIVPLPLAIRALSAIAAGLLLALSYRLHPQAWAPWLMPTALILAAGTRAANARWVGLIAGCGAIAGVLPYYLHMVGTTVTLLMACLRVLSLIFVLRLSQYASAKLPTVWAMFALPVGWAALEQLTLSVSPHGAAGSLVYSQMAHPFLLQLASIGGVPAVLFMLLLPGTLLGLILSKRPSRPEWATAVGVFTALAVGTSVYTFARLRPQDQALPVTLIATNQFSDIPGDWDTVWSVYQPTVIREAARGGLTVLPEKIAQLDSHEADHAMQQLSDAARLTGSNLVVGLEVHDDQGYHGRALLSTPDGRSLWYDKQRLLPGWEDRDIAGTQPLLARLGGTAGSGLKPDSSPIVGLAICKDMHIPSIGREYAGVAGILAVPAWDFGDDGWMGARMSAMRSIESGYTMARSSRSGLLGLYDSAGRVLAEQTVADVGVTSLQARAPDQPRPSLYGRIGDVFGWLCVILACGLWLAMVKSDVFSTMSSKWLRPGRAQQQSGHQA